MLSDFLVFPTTIKTLGVEGASSTSWSGFREFGGNRPQLQAFARQARVPWGETTLSCRDRLVIQPGIFFTQRQAASSRLTDHRGNMF